MAVGCLLDGRWLRGGVVPETELLVAGLGAVGGGMGLDLGTAFTAFTLGPSEKSPQSSKASSSQVDAGSLLGLTGGFVGAFVLFWGTLGGRLASRRISEIAPVTK